MATLTQLTLDGDGLIGSKIRHDAGTGSPFNTHCNDAPDGVSSDYVENDESEGSGEAWFSLSNVNSDFGSMDSLNIDVDVWAETPVANDTITLTARIFAANNDTGTPLTAETASLGTHADTIREQRNVVFGTFAGTKAQWDSAYIRFTWTYVKVSGPDNANLRLYGVDIDGIYTVSAGDDVTVTPDAVSAALSAAVPTITKGTVTTTPDAVVAVFSAVDPTITKGPVTVSPDAATSAFSVPSPTISGIRTLTPDAVVGVFSAVAPVISAPFVLTPNPIALASSAVAPTVLNVNNLTPDAISLVSSAPDPVITKGPVSVTPGAVVGVLSAPAPTIANGITMTPDALILVSSAPAPTIALTQFPDPVTLVSSLPSPTISKGTVTVSPDAVTSVLSAPNPTITKGTVTLLPDPATLVESAVTPTITKGAVTVTPDAVSMALGSVTPIVANGNFLIPDAVSMAATIPNPTISSAITLTPDAVTMSASTVTPVVANGPFVVTPDPVILTLSSPIPVVGEPIEESETIVSINDAQFPAAVYDGIPPNRSSRSQDASPDFEDYDQLMAELIAVQQQQIDDREFIAVNDEGGTLVVGTVVYMKTDGKVADADADGAAALRKAIGIIKVGGANAANVTVQFAGQLTLTAAEWDAVGLGSGGLIVGEAYYMADVPGELTATAPATATDTLFKIGTAISALTLLVRLDNEGLTV